MILNTEAGNGVFLECNSDNDELFKLNIKKDNQIFLVGNELLIFNLASTIADNTFNI
jgi:hypothetical protein